ncbi:HAD family hydrolase [Bacillus tropicus]|uniref:HAD family hydrolase n=1 Tax=Bacillus tropicus TaxID=2026188 RepID=UPI0022DD17B7|nr:HAD family hydrolase [Bacillus tropicus]WBO88774.1 HAD family hydrolase [Bacillus tropicus]
MIQAVLFDLDGTLLDRRQSLEQFIHDQYNRFASHLMNIEKSQYCSRFLALDNNGYTWKDKVYDILLSEYNITTLTQEQLLHDYITNFQHHCIPFQNMHELLQRLTQQNIKIGIITNGFTDFQMNNLRALNIHTHTNTILISEAEGIKKPHPEIFERALKKLDVKATECLYVGDHPENDVLGSERVGILGVWKRDSFWDDFNHLRVVDDLLEVLSFLEVETKTRQ